MSSLLQKKIQDFLESNDLPVARFEREAGLKTNVLRNILRGTSKKPKTETLQAIETYMGCTRSDLLGDAVRSHRTSPQDTSPLVEHPSLLLDALDAVLKIALDKEQSLTFKQAFALAEDAYAYALQKKVTHVDEDFVVWRLSRL